MQFYSTGGKVKGVSFKEAVLQGFAPDSGLYLPESFPQVSLDLIKKLRGLSFLELSIELGKVVFENVLTPDEVTMVCEKAFNFPTPFVTFFDQLNVLELFHGPTLSFKDFGTRFLAALMHMWRVDEEYTVLVATSGDTGSAVGQAFYGLPGMRVFILFAKGHVTPMQKQQLTTIGHNVKAIEIEGSFEECQDLLKKAVLDPELKRVTTANSINIARIFAQSLYYFYAYTQLAEQGIEAIFSVPCGNFGHLVSGLFAKRMGLPIAQFLAATNINDVVPIYLQTGIFKPHEAYPTMAVSMDVGNPSNFPRLATLYDHSYKKMQRDILGKSVTDAQITEAIKDMYATYGYLIDPHTATAYLTLREYLNHEKKDCPGIFFATAHPSKFRESLSPIIPVPIDVPERLQQTLTKKQNYLSLPPDYGALKEVISNNYN